MTFRASDLASPRKHQPVDEKDHKSADDCRDESRPLVGLVPADRAAQKARQKCAGNAQEDGDDATARILAGHEQLRDCAGDAADHNPAKDAV